MLLYELGRVVLLSRGVVIQKLIRSECSAEHLSRIMQSDWHME